ncbi:MAG: FAD-binding protein [Clostridia bacterium]
MKIKYNIDLKNFTTIKIGGKCKTMYFPETRSELIELVNKYNIPYILGGGSNLLISDKCEFDEVICFKQYEKNNIVLNEDEITVSSGVNLQKLIVTINKLGFGGIEYLYSVPGLVGGAIVMNAGRGRGANKQISDYIISVDVLENGKFKTYYKDECNFEYRNSIFKNSSILILSAVFKFDKIIPEEGKIRQQERLLMCKKFQDNRYPNAGTTFLMSNARIMNLMKKFTSESSKYGVFFSDKTSNWLQNRGQGTYTQAIKLIKTVEFLHKIFFKKYKLEYIIWSKK